MTSAGGGLKKGSSYTIKLADQTVQNKKIVSGREWAQKRELFLV
jgi:hypothetical protein